MTLTTDELHHLLSLATEGAPSVKVDALTAEVDRLRGELSALDLSSVQVGGSIDLKGGELLVWDGLDGEPEIAAPQTGFDPEESLVIYIIRDHRVVWRRP